MEEAFKQALLQWACVAGVAVIALGWIFRPDSGEWFD